MCDLSKFVQRLAADALRGRIRSDQLGKFLFQLEQTSEQAVVFRVGYFRSVQHVIEMVVASDLPTKLFRLAGNLFRGVSVSHDMP